MESRIKSIFSSHYFEGILLIVFGFIMLFLPTHSFKIISVITGMILSVLGATLAASYVLHNKEKHTLQLFAGLMCIALGIEFIFHTDNLAGAMHAVLSITLIYSGMLLFIQAYNLRKDRGQLFRITFAFAVIAVIFAVLMLINDEHSSAFLRIKGISMIIEGIASLFVIKENHISK
ncbi:MAG: DUF308 domain-containing protein [Clostridia bacterium]|nr:DUF308 domain-containing protein [Clostridia bacterium]